MVVSKMNPLIYRCSPLHELEQMQETYRNTSRSYTTHGLWSRDHPEVTSLSDIAWNLNDLRYGPRCGRHTCGRYHSLRHSIPLNDGLACCYRNGFYDFVRAPGGRAQPPVSAHTVPFFFQEKLLARCQQRYGHLKKVRALEELTGAPA